jgi:hypothetical protein
VGIVHHSCGPMCSCEEGQPSSHVELQVVLGLCVVVHGAPIHTQTQEMMPHPVHSASLPRLLQRITHILPHNCIEPIAIFPVHLCGCHHGGPGNIKSISQRNERIACHAPSTLAGLSQFGSASILTTYPLHDRVTRTRNSDAETQPTEIKIFSTD